MRKSRLVDEKKRRTSDRRALRTKNRMKSVEYFPPTLLGGGKHGWHSKLGTHCDS